MPASSTCKGVAVGTGAVWHFYGAEMVTDPIQSGAESSTTSNVSLIGQAAENIRPVPIDTLEGRWWVLHTRARNEKAVAASLEKLRINHFLPLVEHRRIYSGRVHLVKIPLFPGYVFLCGGSEDRLAALRTNRIANVLEVGDQERLKTDLRHIQRVVESNEPVELYPRLRRGCRCRVTSGVLAGLEGVVLRRRGPWRVYVGVEFLGQSAELEIDPMLLEVID
jgi:transcription antitermination factor NusG